MADVFLSSDTKSLLENKYVIIMGDSVQRTLYKDLVCLLQEDQYMTDKQLRCKGDLNFLKDTLIEGGKLATLSNGSGYREMREYHTDYHLVKFYFITRCYYGYVEKILESIKGQELKPDVFIMNSCVWDISRYGLDGVAKYKENLHKLVDKLKSVLPEDCVVIWNTTLPISSDAKGGFLVPEVEFMTSSLHLDILQANFFAQKIMMAAGFDVLDLHYHLRHHSHRRAEDGIHWDMTAHRRITNLLLTHISEAWGREVPRNVDEYTSIDTEFLARTLADDEANNNGVPLNITQRPKAKARRRMRARKKNGNTTRNNSTSMNRGNVLIGDSRRMVNIPSSLGQSAMNGRVTPLQLQTQIMNINQMKAGLPQSRSTWCSSCAAPDRRYLTGNVNLPMMVDPQERYGGPINHYSYNNFDHAMWSPSDGEEFGAMNHGFRSHYGWQESSRDPFTHPLHMGSTSVENWFW